MRHRLRAGLVLAAVAIVPALERSRCQTLDDPGELLAVYAAIARDYRGGDGGAAARLLALGPARLRALHEIMGHAIARQPELLARESSPWTAALFRAAALLHTEIAIPSFELRDRAAFEPHVEAAERLLVLAEQREPARGFRARWHVAVGLQLLAGAEIDGARTFLARGCQEMPARAQLRLACAMASDVYASTLKMAPPDPAYQMNDPSWPAAQREKIQRELARERATLLADAEGHLKAALAADPSLDEARLRLAYIHIQRAHDSDAEQLLAALAARERPVPLAYLARLMLGGVRERQNQLDKAVTLYRDASALIRGAPRARTALAHALHATGDRAAARDIVEEVVTARVDPDEPWTRYAIAFIATPCSTLEDLRQEVRK